MQQQVYQKYVTQMTNPSTLPLLKMWEIALSTPVRIDASARQTLLGPTRAQNLTILSSAIPEKFKGCKILKWITWPGPCPFQAWSVTPTLDIACKHTKFDDASFSRSEGISLGVKLQSWSRDPDHALFRDGLSLTSWNMVWQTYSPNLKCLTSPVMEIWKALQNVENGVVWGG